MTRRTPTQIAADEAAETKAQLERTRDRAVRLEGELARVLDKAKALKALYDYRAAHPLLQVDTTDDVGADA